MYEAYDWIIGLAEPELGGDPSLVDVVGLNFYPHNQWYYQGPTIPMGHHEYRPLADMLVEMAERYGKPVFLVRDRRGRLGQAVLASLCLRRGAGRAWTGAPSRGHLLYPITAYPGWDNSAATPKRDCCRRSSSDGSRHVDRARCDRGTSSASGAIMVRGAVRRSARAAARLTESRRTASRRATECGRSAGCGGC